MDSVTAYLGEAGSGLLRLLAQPLLYVSVLLLLLPYWRQTRLERRMFAVRLKAWPGLLARAALAGLAGGLAVSLVALLLGVRLTADTVYWVWGAALALSLFRIHYLCVAYAVGLLGVLQWMAGRFGLEGGGGPSWAVRAADSLAALDIPGLLLLAALLHAAEAVLLRRQGGRQASPLYAPGKRGRLVGAYRLQGMWPVPLLLLTPAEAGGSSAALPWTPLLWPDGGAPGWTFAALPVVVAFSAVTRTMLPAAKARLASGRLLIYAGVLGIVAAGAAWWHPLTPVAALCAPLLHEALVVLDRRREAEGSPYYVHDDRGLRVLAVVPGSPADELGIEPGEILYKVNGVRTRSREELYEALHVNAAFTKLEVLNHEGQSKFAQRARYEGEHHQLGVVLAPDESALYYAEDRPASLPELVFRRREARRVKEAAPAERDAT